MAPFTHRPKRIRFDFINAPPRAEPVPAPAPGTSEHNLTPGQKIALLILRRSDWSKAILNKLKEMGLLAVNADDFRSLVPLNLAIAKGHAYHVPTRAGRWRADRVAEEFARDLDIHVIAYDYGSYGRAPFWHCTCGTRSYHSRNTPWNFVGKLVRGGRLHLEHVGAVKKEDAA